MMIRRGLATPQAVGTPATTDNAFSGYWEDTIFENPTTSTQTVYLQFAQNIASTTASVVQTGGYVLIDRLS